MKIGAAFDVIKWRYLLLFFLGIFTGASQLTPLIFKLTPLVGIPLFLWIQNSLFTEKKAAILALGFFKWGYYTIALYWIMIALSIDLEHFWWLVPFSLLGLPLILSLFSVVLSWVIPWYKYSNRLLLVLLFAMVWALSELLHSILFTGLPWALLAYIWAPFLPLCQSIALISIYGLSFLTVLLAATPFLIATPTKKYKLYTGLIIVIFLGLYLWGSARLQMHPPLQSNTFVRLVQPNIAQSIKWNAQHQRENLHRLIQLSVAPSKHQLQAIIWPESALTYTLTPLLQKYLYQKLPHNTLLITGALRYETNTEHYQVWNSLFVFHQGQRVATYDKTHLVPFGEYVPLRNAIENIFGHTPLKKITHGFKDISFGQQRQSIKVSNLPAFYPLICYEIIFPYPDTKKFAASPQWILNLTNDAWYGDTAGPYQHLDIARFRAIETGKPVIRVANTGISAVIDAYGRILDYLPFNTEGFIDVALPVSEKQAV